MLTRRMTSRPEERIGRTARWPASLLFMKYDGRRCGLWLRLGDHACYFALVPRPRRRPYHGHS